MTKPPEISLSADVAPVGRMKVVPLILEVIGRSTNMGFTAVARVTTDRWIACQVRDEIKFGLMPGGELKVDTTICHEIRQTGAAVIIDHVSEDEVYAHHHTPAQYGFQSYISIPIARQDGTFFGTLCAIDPNPALLNTPHIISMFRNFASLISFHLNAAEQLPEGDWRMLEQQTIASLQSQFSKVLDKHIPIEMQLDKRSQQFAQMVTESSDKVKELLAVLNNSISKTVDGV